MAYTCGSCHQCPYLVKSTAIAIVGTTLQITIPTMTLTNKQPLCVVLAQTIPSGVTADMNVQIVDGTSTINVVTCTSNFLYADQIACRKVLRMKIATDTLIAKLIYHSCIRCTCHVFPTLPTTS